MDRRKSIKALLIGAAATGVFIEACKNSDKKITASTTVNSFTGPDRMVEENEAYKKIAADNFFTEHELATMTILADIIIPKDATSGSASETKVVDFIEFTVKEQTEHQTPMRGGLRWLDMQCLNRFEKTFKQCNTQQQIEIVDEIAYPKKAKPAMQQGVSFFTLMRNLTVTGFYTSEMGVKDLGYLGNVPTQWNGVPDDVLKQYGLQYSEKQLKECVSYDKA